MAAPKMIGDIERKRLEELKRLEKRVVFIYPDELNKNKAFVKATENCMAVGYFIGCTTKTMPNERSSWKSEKDREGENRYLKFKLPDETDLSTMLEQFDAGELTIIVLQTTEHHVAIICRRICKFVQDIVPDKLKPIVVNGSLDDLIKVMEEFCKTPQKQPALPSRQKPAGAGRTPKAVQPEPANQEGTDDDGEDQPSSDMEVDEGEEDPTFHLDADDGDQTFNMEVDEDGEEQSSQVETNGRQAGQEVIPIPYDQSASKDEDEEEEQPLPMEIDEIAPDTSANPSPTGGQEDEEEDADVENIPREPEPSKPAKSSAWLLHTSASKNDEGHQTAETLALGDEDGEAMRFIREGCGHDGPGPCKWCTPQEEVSLIAVKKRKKRGPKSKFDLAACIKSMDKLIKGRKEKGDPFPTASECAQQAVKDGVKSHPSTIRNKIRDEYTARYNGVALRGN